MLQISYSYCQSLLLRVIVGVTLCVSVYVAGWLKFRCIASRIRNLDSVISTRPSAVAKIGQNSTDRSGVPQGPVLSPMLLFVKIYVNIKRELFYLIANVCIAIINSLTFRLHENE